jgi:TetR/AcrR family transcriptional regulator, mexJK operon transcriptional repressor
MGNLQERSLMFNRRVGRPRRGTEVARTEALINAATRVFLRDGYGQASIDRVAAEAGVSTRTIYERYKNKADLFGATIDRLVDRMTTVLTTADLSRLNPRAGLLWIAQSIADRARDPDGAALFRIIATEAHRFPDLAAKMRQNDKRCIDATVADYLKSQVERGALQLADVDKAATLFLRMIFSEMHECWLFGDDDALAQRDLMSHAREVVDLFLLGALPRPDTAIAT